MTNKSNFGKLLYYITSHYVYTKFKQYYNRVIETLHTNYFEVAVKNGEVLGIEIRSRRVIPTSSKML